MWGKTGCNICVCKENLGTSSLMSSITQEASFHG